MTQPNLPPAGATEVYAELLRQVDEYELHFGNEARVRDGVEPTLGNLLIDKLAFAVRTLCARVAALEPDARRWRWYRDGGYVRKARDGWEALVSGLSPFTHTHWHVRETMDEAVDAAIAAQEVTP